MKPISSSIGVSPDKSKFQEGVNDFFQKHLSNTRFYKYLIGVSNFYDFTRQLVHAALNLHKENLNAFARVIINQVKFTGTKALPLLSIIALTIGASTIIQALTFLPKFGAADSFMGKLLKYVIVREIGPLITAIVILTRSGSAIAAELATQKLHREIEAVELMGINPLTLMVLPRVIGGLIATSLLIVYFDFIAFMGGYFISSLVTNFPFSLFLKAVIEAISLSDLFATAVKAVVYGITIPLTCSYFGFHPTTLFEIPIFVSKAVVRSLFGIFILNALTSVIFYL